MTWLSLFDPNPDSASSRNGNGNGKLKPSPSEPAHLTVSELTELIKVHIEDMFDQVTVLGEVSGVARPRSGHLYFKLKDQGALLDAVIWRNRAKSLMFDLTDGLEAIARGHLEVYAPQGKYQLIIDRIEPRGVGALELAFRQRFERLKAEGLFDPERKRPLPAFPRRIAIVTSPTGAAVRDIIQIIHRRWRGTALLVIPVRVQGEGAAEEIAEGIAKANRIDGVDLIIAGRGGGSLEDLWPFNEEIVARAIYHSRLPVISAVGHEVDVTIADHVADRRALTPSEAGEIAAPDGAQIAMLLGRTRDRLDRALALKSRSARDQLDRLSGRLGQSIRNVVPRAKSRLESLASRADHAMAIRQSNQRSQLQRLAAQLEALSPLGVLARGYSITLKAQDNAVIRNAGDVKPGDLIRTQTAGGSILSRVENG